MLLTAGKIVRFKGSRAEAEAVTFEAEMQGRCKREGTSILITRTTRLAVAASAQFGSNGGSEKPELSMADFRA